MDTLFHCAKQNGMITTRQTSHIEVECIDQVKLWFKMRYNSKYNFLIKYIWKKVRFFISLPIVFITISSCFSYEWMATATSTAIALDCTPNNKWFVNFYIALRIVFMWCNGTFCEQQSKEYWIQYYYSLAFYSLYNVIST